MTMAAYELDVRPILKAGDEPFSTIMGAVARLEPGQSLKLLAPFKPVPLFGVLAARGFEPHAREIGSGDWEVLFSPVRSVQDDQEAKDPPDRLDWPAPRVELDNRNLDPPEPMVRTLEAVETLAPGETVAALLPREPLFLLEALNARGHKWRGGFEADGSFRIVIRAVETERRRT